MDSTERTEKWNKIKDALKRESGSDSHSFRHTDTPPKVERLCQLPKYIATISASYKDKTNVTKNVPEKDYYYREAPASFYKVKCKTTDILISKHSDTKITIPMDADHYEVKDLERYVPQTICERANQQIEPYVLDNKTTYPDLLGDHIKILSIIHHFLQDHSRPPHNPTSSFC